MTYHNVYYDHSVECDGCKRHFHSMRGYMLHLIDVGDDHRCMTDDEIRHYFNKHMGVLLMQGTAHAC